MYRCIDVSYSVILDSDSVFFLPSRRLIGVPASFRLPRTRILSRAPSRLPVGQAGHRDGCNLNVTAASGSSG